MRALIVSSLVVLLSACASQAPAPAGKTAASSTQAKASPQCYSSDHGRFFKVNEKTAIAGVNVVCKATSDGKAAQWMGDKH